MPVIDKAERIRALNDAFRSSNTARTLVLTRGVAALNPTLQRQIILALASFDRFDADNDPYGEHDFGAFTVSGHRLFFKIDYYDRSCLHHSPDPADPAVTCRVLTLMLADEY
ncbi:DUF3768 domain-containing protein [Lichenihabitans sp. PAMC28606]|uniref:DUF3768 domain-containing protein n=1 Tax=Lichenihabitans sp. PAMC28606 TaxID=2880932 RepID=UPI001D0BC80B|nr:DUF3768 domain-containing protein [Lichenihabitans sp. PAMC28606]UDL96237.1 DUF3768 domain-containing protein [Lichenihabitans sp. PAMC28606]